MGVVMFAHKRAEMELWPVDMGFIEPPFFPFFLEMSSLIIYGLEGVGKTTIARALKSYAYSNGYLPVMWLPKFPGDQEAGTDAAYSFFSSLFSPLADTLTQYLLKSSSNEMGEPGSKSFLAAFSQRYHPNPQKMLSQCSDDEKELWAQLLTQEALLALSNLGDDIDLMVDELCFNLSQLGGRGIWVIMDGLNTANLSDLQITQFKAFLSTLKFFENPMLAFKLILPASLEMTCNQTNAASHDRIERYRIVWDDQRLIRLIEKRMAAATGQMQIQLKDIYNLAVLTEWLRRCGGNTPRGWIEYMRPIASSYYEIMQNEGQRPLQNQEWRLACQRASLQLRYNREAGEIVTGQSLPRALSPDAKALFDYLYDNPNRVCSKHELYKNVYLPLNPAGSAGAASTASSKTFALDYDDLINTAIHRLRLIVEPLVKEPIFIQTVRGQGFKLSLNAFE